MDAQNVFECGRLCASGMGDVELASSVMAVLAMLLLMLFWDTRFVRWLRAWAVKVLDGVGMG